MTRLEKADKMRDQDKTKDELIAELVAMRQQVASLKLSSCTSRKRRCKKVKNFHLLVENVQDYLSAGYERTLSVGT